MRKPRFEGRVELKKPITHVNVSWYQGSYHFGFTDEEAGVIILSGYAEERALCEPIPKP